MSGLAEAVARYAFKLMAYKDEYEVARLFTDGTFRDALAEQFEGDFRIEFSLAPPLFARPDPETGEVRKRTYGPWMMTAFRLLAGLRRLRGTPFDIFGRTAERRMERELIETYFEQMREVTGALDRDNHAAAVELARVPEFIRGYGHVKQRHVVRARAMQSQALAAFREPDTTRAAAE